MLTGDPFLEYDPCTYVLVYSYPQQVANYPAIQQALPHILCRIVTCRIKRIVTNKLLTRGLGNTKHDLVAW